MLNRRDLVVVTILAWSLTACSADPEPNAGRTPAGSDSAGGKANAPRAADEATRNMVSGVTGGRQGELLDLKFELKSRPQVGEPLMIDVALIPRVASPTLRATYIATDGLAVRDSDVPAEYQNVQADSVYRQQLTVVPKENGVYYVNAVVTIQTDAGDLSRTFSIPVLVGPPPEEEEVGGRGEKGNEG